jgi:uncharacterized protein (TIGR02594 family)
MMLYIATPQDPAHLKLAAAKIGERETGGPNKSPYIAKLWALLGNVGLLGQPWCGTFVAEIMREIGQAYPAFYFRALAWNDWGVACTPRLGAIVTMRRKGGGHVAFAAGRTTDGKIVILGGNQNNSVCLDFVAESDIEQWRAVSGSPLVPLTEYPASTTFAQADSAAERFA